MITDRKNKAVKDELNRSKLADYWNGYFEYQECSPELYKIAEEGLKKKINDLRKMDKPYVDSQQVISNLLTEFGKSHVFHRKFREQLPDLHSNQVLGMHLYHIMIRDQDIWEYTETQHPGHKFPHAAYWQPS